MKAGFFLTFFILSHVATSFLLPPTRSPFLIARPSSSSPPPSFSFPLPKLTKLAFSEASPSESSTLSLETEQDLWQARLESAEVAFVRNELIERYTSAGHSQTKAESEVDNFLNDRSRSENFLDMRRMALEQEIGQWSPELGLWLGLAFVAGMVGNAAPKIIENFHFTANSV